MKPTPGDLHVNRLLTNLSIGLFQDMEGFIATKVFPIIGSEFQSDSYTIFDETYFNRDTLTKRAPGARSKLIGWKPKTPPTFYADVWSAAHLIPDQSRANADSVYELDAQANELVVRAAKIRLEKMWVNSFFKAGVWGYDVTGVASGPSTNQFLRWDDSASTPIQNISAARLSMMSKTGRKPNTLVVGAQVHEALVNNAQLMGRIVYGGTPGDPAVVNEAAMARLFGIQRYLVMEAIEETLPESVAGTSSTAFIGGKHALLMYVPPNPGRMVPASGLTFAWTGYTGATPEGYRIKKFRMEPEASDVVEIEIAVDMKVTAPSLGAFFGTAIS